jgi:hypothetical protein
MILLYTIHLAATWAMAGIIWSVQQVQYPLFMRVEQAQFPRYHEAHVKRIGPIVAPLMLVEAVSGVALLWHGAQSPLFLVALGFLAVVWVSTFALQVPLHRQLASRWNPRHVRTLVRTNWVRTWGWSARAVLLLIVMGTHGDIA